MTAKQYLQQAFLLNKQIDSCQLLLDDLRSKATSVLAMTIKPDKIQTSSPGDRIGDLIAKIVDLEAEVNEMIDRYVELKRDIIQKINTLSDEKCRLILQERYLNFKKWEQVAIDNDIDLRWVYRIHTRALSEIKIFDH